MGAIWTGEQTIYVTHTPGLLPKCWPLIRKRHFPKPTPQTPARVPEWPDGARVSLQPPGPIPLQTLATVMGKDAPSLPIPPFINPARCANFPRQHQALLQLPTAPLVSTLPVGPHSARYCCIPNCFPVKHWQRCYDSITTDPLLLTLSITGTGSDAKQLKLSQT